MKPTRYGAYAVAGLWTAIVACSASGALDQSNPGPVDPKKDGGFVDAGRGNDAEPVVDLDAARPLVCGEAGFCETRLPTSDIGVPLVLEGVWAVSANDVWSVTAEGYVLHFDGASWSTDFRTSYPLSAVWATATGVWAGGEQGPLLHKRAGGEWTYVEMSHVSTIRAIAGTSDNDVWFASEDGLVDHFDGAALALYPIDIPGIEITTVAARPGRGAYAAGFVRKGTYKPGQGVPMDHEPYILELGAAGISVFNPLVREQTGFVPVTIDVTESADVDRKIVMVGYKDYRDHRQLAYAVFGAASSVAIRDIMRRDGLWPVFPIFANQSYMDPYPAWVRSWDDVLVPHTQEYEYTYILRVDANGSTSRSLAMGPNFVPRRIRGMHGNSTEGWLVGEGFALKGAMP
jgi:hypothetical protein